MNAAASAAQEAFTTWRETSLMTRQQVMFKLQALIRENMVSSAGVYHVMHHVTPDVYHVVPGVYHVTTGVHHVTPDACISCGAWCVSCDNWCVSCVHHVTPGVYYDEPDGNDHRVN